MLLAVAGITLGMSHSSGAQHESLSLGVVAPKRVAQVPVTAWLGVRNGAEDATLVCVSSVGAWTVSSNGSHRTKIRSKKVVMPRGRFSVFAVSLVGTYFASFVFFALIPRLSPSVSLAATIALVLVASVGFITGFIGSRAVALHHFAGAVLAAFLISLTAISLKRELDNPVREPPPFLWFAERHLGLGFIIIGAIVLASIAGFWVGQLRFRR
jgi:hypothetical protein